MLIFSKVIEIIEIIFQFKPFFGSLKRTLITNSIMPKEKINTATKSSHVTLELCASSEVFILAFLSHKQLLITG